MDIVAAGIKVIEAPKVKFTWIAPLEELELEHEPIYLWYSDRMKVVPLISRDIKNRYPEREYETCKKVIEGVELLKIWRNK